MKPYKFIPMANAKYIAVYTNTQENRDMIYALNKLTRHTPGACRLRIRYRGPMSARRIGRENGWHNDINSKAARDCLAANATHFVVYRCS